MVPPIAALPDGLTWFPRPRGDGPYYEGRGATVQEVPPPARGWSPDHPAVHMEVAGSPARAGMVPQKETDR